ncbi:alpha-protein kinase 2 isoform X2 [Heptranchias perlo]|uniref:alpha-protein kinase 2 isoform X2 n=1 Tax=Heptranchias perlo TaxID=212740 RepID=UPI00355A5058
MFPKMSAEFVAESSPRFGSTLKSQKVVENVDVQLSCTVFGNPEPEVTWYKGDKQLPKFLGPPKYEMLKDDKVHTLKLYRCTEDDAAIYQVSARNSKGIAICSSVLQVGFVTEAQVRQKMMQKLKEKNEAKKTLESRPSELDSPNSWRCYSKSPKDGISNTAAKIHINSTSNRVQSSTEGEEADNHTAESLEETPSGVPGFTSAEQMVKLGELNSSSVPYLPSTVKGHQLNHLRETVGGSQGSLPVGGQSRNSRMSNLNGAGSPKGHSKSSMKLSQTSDGVLTSEGLIKGGVQRCKWGCPANLGGDEGSLTPEDEYYLDSLVCSDILTDQDKAVWQHKLQCPRHLFLAESDGPETDEVKLTCSRPPAPLGLTEPPVEAIAQNIISVPRYQSRATATEAGEMLCSGASFPLVGIASGSDRSGVVRKGGDEICPISPEDRPELPTLTIQAEMATSEEESSKASSASSNGLQENREMMICERRETPSMGSGSDNVIGLEMFDKVAEVEREKVLYKEYDQKLSKEEEEDNRAEGQLEAVSILGGVSLPAGEPLDIGDMYTTEILRDKTGTGGRSGTATDSRLTHQSCHPVKTPPSLGNGSTPPLMEGVGIRRRGEEIEIGSEEKNDSSSGWAEIQPALLKDGETSFTKNTVSLTSNEDDHSSYRTCHEKKTDVLPLDTYVTLSSQQDNHDHEADCERLNTDCKILRNALTVESIVSQSSDFKDKYHAQDKRLLCDKKSNFNTKDELTGISKNDEPSLLQSLCLNSTGNKTKNINHKDISNVTYVENEAPCKTEEGMNNDHRIDAINENHSEQVCKKFYYSTERVMSPVRCSPTENEHFNFQSRIGQTPNSETVLDLEDHLVTLLYNNKPEVVKSVGLQSSMSWLTDVGRNIPPLTGRNQPRMINIEDNKVVNIMEYLEFPATKERESSTACLPITDQSISLQETPRPVQNSMEHVVEVDMEEGYGRVRDVEDVQTIVTGSLESSLIDGSNLNITQRIQPTLQDESHVECLSLPVAEKTKATENIHDIEINATANFKRSEDSSSHFDKTMIFQGATRQVEKNSENHNVIATQHDSELGQGHFNTKMTSTENLESATFSVGSIRKVPSETEQVKNLKVRSSTIDLNENAQKVEYLHDCKANLNEISECFVTNMDEVVGLQSKEGQLMNYKEKETAVVTAENNETVQHNDFFQLTAVNSIGSSIITQRVVDQIMNVDSIAPENFIELNKRPIGSNLIKSNDTVVVPDHSLECIKMNTHAECKGKICQMSILPSKSNQTFSTESKVKNVPLHYKNDNNQTEPLCTQAIYEGQKRTIDPEPSISLQTKSLTEKSIPSIQSHNKQQTTVVRIKQPASAALAKELMSGARKKTNFLKPSSEVTSATTEAVGLAPSLNDQQKKEAVKRMRLSAGSVGKFSLEKSKQTYSSAGKENLNKNTAVTKRMYQTAEEEPAHKKEHKELKKVKHPQKDEHKAPKLIQKIRAEVFPDISGDVKLWCLFCDIHADSTIIWTKDGAILTKIERSAGDDSPVSLAIVQTTKKDRGLYQCSLKNVYGSVSCEFDFTTEGQSIIEPANPNDLHTIPGSVAGEEIELLQPIVEKELINECNFDDKMCGSIATEELHFGEGLHRKAFRTKVIYGLVPLFDPGHICVLKIHNSIAYGTKTNNEVIQRNYILAVQECHVQNAARQYGNMFSAEGTLLEGFGEAPEVIPIYLIHRPANTIPYATVEEELIGEFVKYSVKDGRELNVGRRESEVGQKCCTFQHWVYQWTEGNLLVTDMQGVGMKLTDVGIATCSKGYKGFKGNCSISFIDHFKALHQCNMYCKMMGLKSLKVSQHKPKRNPPMKTQVSQPTPRSTKKMPQSPRSTKRSFTSQAKSISGEKHL